LTLPFKVNVKAIFILDTPPQYLSIKILKALGLKRKNILAFLKSFSITAYAKLKTL
jgi:hypothetical protein